ncbi:phosphatase PAP2 family protein [Massilia sp. RP-1-19]|uniref:Phosphatase PAP2 family protein n=1 Tax=Massilia polaris TaxID=2728846 RepID=A0A848HQN6_9BURK|nr:phosphatase PAP2 family protein [Massilia polaris]NML63277.1 phosphatase PAP2 family protein [Massilia polaris]
MKADRGELRGVPLLGARALTIIAVALACSGLGILCLGHTGIDLWLADAAFDPVRRAFPWRDTWLADQFNHRILKVVFTVAGGGLIAAVLADMLRPSRKIAGPARLRLRIVALSAALVPLVTSTLKQASDAHCPWDLARYGGGQPYVRLFESLPFGADAGHCLPAGHASTSLWLVSLAVFWLPGSQRKAAAVAALGLAIGLAMGWMQQLRGAHFLTHTLWSLWIAVLVVSVTTLLVDAAARRYTPHTTS